MERRMSYVLVLFVYAGVLSKGDSVALTNVPGFKSEVLCEEAGKSSVNLAKGTYKDAKFVCLKQEK
jgi:hypothetical protein